ncbi:MAG: trigger factor [Oscillospiraceae bacterium]|nr:trigger factor [Oscillospiraceae bacterium]
MQKDTYKGLKAAKNVHKVTEQEISDYLEKLRQANTRTEVITDRPAQDGDEVIIDYAGFVGDEQFAGGTAQNQPLTLGSGTFIPGFEEQLVGAEIGSEVDVHVTFPEVYHSADLAGKEAVFKCKVHEIHVKTPYEMDDTFAQNIANLPTLAEMREVLRQQMQAAADESAYNQLVDELLFNLAQVSGTEGDAEAIEREIDGIIATMEQQIQQQGFSIDQYLQITGRTMEELREAQRPQAEFGARVSAALDEICALEAIEATEEDFEREYGHIAAQCGISVEQVKGFFGEDSIEAIGRDIRQKKAVALIIANADITEVEQ